MEADLADLLSKRASLISKVESKLSVKEDIAMVASECLGYRKDFENLRNSEAFTLLSTRANELINLKLAAEYAHFLSDLYSIRERCMSFLERSDFPNAIKSYEQYDKKADQIQIIKSSSRVSFIETAMGTIANHLKETHLKTFQDINYKLKLQQLAILKEMNWPKLQDNQEIPDAFAANFLIMTRLKIPPRSSDHSRIILSSFACLVNHYRTAFKYHFYGDRPTNKLEKPEYYLSFLLAAIKEQATFLEGYLQRILDESNIQLIALHEFIAALLEIVFEKLDKERAKILENLKVFRHTLEELLLFDHSLEELYLYSLHNSPSCASFFLNDQALKDLWLQIEEKELSFNLDSILSLESHLGGAYSSAPLEEDQLVDFRISKSADALAIMFSESKGRYKHLPISFRKTLFDFAHRPRFIVYLEALKNVVRKLQTTFYPVNDKMVTKTKDLIDVCNAINSMSYIHSLLWNWSCDPYFLLNDEDNGSIFEGLLESYQTACQKSLLVLAEELFLDIRPVFSQYERKDWTDTSTAFQDMACPELLPVLSILSFSKQILLNLSKGLFKGCISNLCGLIDAHLMENLLQKKRMTTAAYSQFQADLNIVTIALTSVMARKSLFSKCDGYCSS